MITRTCRSVGLPSSEVRWLWGPELPQENVESSNGCSMMLEPWQWGCRVPVCTQREKTKDVAEGYQNVTVGSDFTLSFWCGRTDLEGFSLWRWRSWTVFLGTAGSAHADLLVGGSWWRASSLMSYRGPSLQFSVKAVSWSKGPALPSLACLPLKSPPATVLLMIFLTGRESTIVCLVCFKNRFLNLQATVQCVSETWCPRVCRSTRNHKHGTSLWGHGKWQH